MNIVILVLITQFVIHWIESHHDYHVIMSQNFNPTADQKSHNRSWHKWDAANWFIIHLLISYLTVAAFSPGNIKLFICILLSGLIDRLMLMQINLNYLLKQDTFYLPDKGIDGVMKRVFGELFSFILKMALWIWIVVTTIHLSHG